MKTCLRWGRLGKVRTRKVKVLAKQIKELYGQDVTASFEDNKRLVRSVLEGRFSKRFANRVAGYLSALVKLEKKAAEQASTETKAGEETVNV